MYITLRVLFKTVLLYLYCIADLGVSWLSVFNERPPLIIYLFFSDMIAKHRYIEINCHRKKYFLINILVKKNITAVRRTNSLSDFNQIEHFDPYSENYNLLISPLLEKTKSYHSLYLFLLKTPYQTYRRCSSVSLWGMFCISSKRFLLKWF